MLIDYLPIVILLVIALGFALGMLALTHLLGPRHPNPAKLSTYESGVPPVGDARLRFSIKFYLVAMLFIVFDIEVVFLYPWAVLFQEFVRAGHGLFLFVEMLVFLGILIVGLLYIYGRRALEWE